MPELDRKKKMISLRLSDAEYAILKSQYRSHGARNVSDLARLALARIVQPSADPLTMLAERVAELEENVHSLQYELSQILERSLARS